MSFLGLNELHIYIDIEFMFFCWKNIDVDDILFHPKFYFLKMQYLWGFMSIKFLRI